MGELGWEQQGVWEQVNRQESGNRDQDIRWGRIRGAGVEVAREQGVNIRGREWRITITGSVGRADCIITGWRHNKFGLSCTFGPGVPPLAQLALLPLLWHNVFGFRKHMVLEHVQ